MRGVGLTRRGAFLRESGPAHEPDRLHLHIVCTNEDDCGLLLVVPLCTLEPYTRDRACELGVGDHPFIKRRSFIHYAKAEILEKASLQEALRRGSLIPHEDCDEEVFDRVLHGLGTTKAIRPKTAKYFTGTTKPLPEAA